MITIKDIREAATGNLSPFTPYEIVQLLACKNDDEFIKFFKKLIEQYKLYNAKPNNN